MCGIAGILGPVDAASVERVRAMASALGHRGPDDFGTWCTPTSTSHRGEPVHVAFGHTRLAVLDPTSRARQPMTSADGRATLVFNGEIYNFRRLRRELERLGHEFRTEGDSEVLLAGYREWGLGVLERLAGMFAFAVWDRDRERLVLARDRLGIKPLFYSLQGPLLLFGSELGALRAHPGFETRIDRASVGRFLRYGYVSGRPTIYECAARLQPGEVLVYENGAATLSCYWTLTAEEPAPGGGFQAVVDRVEALLTESVSQRLVADVPVGALLSGGIDSSAVVSLMQELSRGPVKTFTIGYRDRAYDESESARGVAAALGTDHVELIVGRDEAVDTLRRLPEVYDEPFGDPSAVPAVLVSQLARKEVTVVLTGDGGDELFGGYGRYRRLERLAPWLGLLHRFERPIRAAAGFLPLRPLARVAPLVASAEAAEAADAMTSRFAAHHIAACCGAAAAAPRQEFLAAFAAAPRPEPARRAMFADLHTYIPDDILVKLDRATMSVGLEGRVPILDHHLAAYAAGLPLSAVWHGGRTKAPLFEVAARRLPRALLERPKRGFGLPIDTLLGEQITAWTGRYLASERIREEGLLAPSAVAAMVESARRDRRLGAKRLWYLLCFERWYARHHRGERE